MGIDQDTLSIVDDLDLFFSYLWGRIGYRHLLKGFHNSWARKFIDVRTNEEKEVTYTLHCFPITLQIWAYEAVPKIGQRFAKRVSEWSPRLLCWSYAKQPQPHTYDAFFKNAQLHVHTMLIAMDVSSLKHTCPRSCRMTTSLCSCWTIWPGTVSSHNLMQSRNVDVLNNWSQLRAPKNSIARNALMMVHPLVRRQRAGLVRKVRRIVLKVW